MARVFSRWDRRQRQQLLYKRGGVLAPIFGLLSSRRNLWRFLFSGLVILAILPFVYFHFRLHRFQKMNAYNHALSSHVDCIEIDVSRSLDGVLFALHDRDLQRITANASAKVGHFTTEEIAGFGRSHQRLVEFADVNIPTVEDALKLVSRSVRQVILDAKIGPPLHESGLARDILALVKRNKCKNCIIWAKSDSLVQDLIRHAQGTMVGYIVMIDPATGSRMKLLRMREAEVVAVYHPLINDKLVNILHGSHKKVYAWTVDEEQSMMKLLPQQVDAMVTSNPTLLQQVMQRARRQCDERGFSKAW